MAGKSSTYKSQKLSNKEPVDQIPIAFIDNPDYLNQFSGQFIAITNVQIIAIAESIPEIHEKLQQLNNQNRCRIRYIESGVPICRGTFI